MNWSASEWALDRLLEEVLASPAIPQPPVISDCASPVASSSGASQSSTSKREEGDDEVVEIKKPHIDGDRPCSQLPLNPRQDPSPAAPFGTDQYHTFLKNQLDLACAAVALTRASSANPGGSVQSADAGGQAWNPPQLVSQAHGRGISNDFSIIQNESRGGPLGIPALPVLPRKPAVQVVQTTSGSSRDESDDDEIDGDMDNLDNMDPTDAKRARRMRSNRESARRSRRKKQAHMNELETQVSQLKVEHSTLLKHFSDMNQKHDDAAVDNRILKADIETLRAKVKMAEEIVKRVTGINPILAAMANNSPITGMPYVNTQLAASTNGAVPLQPNTQFFHQPVLGVPSTTENQQRMEGTTIQSNPPIPNISSQQHLAGVNNGHDRLHHPGKNGSGGSLPGWDHVPSSHNTRNHSKQN